MKATLLFLSFLLCSFALAKNMKKVELKSTQIDSRLFCLLNSMITNRGGKLERLVNGNFKDSCEQIQLDSKTGILSAKCRTAGRQIADFDYRTIGSVLIDASIDVNFIVQVQDKTPFYNYFKC